MLIRADFPLRIWPLHHDYGIIVMDENRPDSLGDKPLVYRNFLVMEMAVLAVPFCPGPVSS